MAEMRRVYFVNIKVMKFVCKECEKSIFVIASLSRHNCSSKRKERIRIKEITSDRYLQ
jgi:hypothetical protein